MSELLYQGTVTIIRRYQGRFLSRQVLKNNGENPLFLILCNFLGGKSVAPEDQPNYLDIIGYPNEGEAGVESLLYSPVQISSSESWVDAGSSSQSPSLTKVFNLNYLNIRSPQKEYKRVYLVLRDESRKDSEGKPVQGKIMARVPIVDESGNYLDQYPIGQDESHEIYWKMSFANARSTSVIYTATEQEKKEETAGE